MITQNSVTTLDTKTLQDAVNESVYQGRRVTDFRNSAFHWELEESAQASKEGIKYGTLRDLQWLRNYVTYRAGFGSRECLASQRRICEDAGYVCRKTIRWMLRVLVWAKHIIKLPYNSQYATHQYIPNPNLNEWQKITPQLIAKAKAFRVVSRNEEEVNQEDQETFSFFESSDEGISPINIPKNIYLEEEHEITHSDTNKELLNDSPFSRDTTLDATYPLTGLDEEVEQPPQVELLIDEPTPDIVDVPIKKEGYSLLERLAVEMGLTTIQEVIRELYKEHQEGKQTKEEKEVKHQSPVEEVATLDATQPAKVVEKEVEQVISLIPPLPEKKKYKESELIQKQAQINYYLSGKGKEYEDIAGVSELIADEKARVRYMPDNELMEYPIPNPGIEEGLSGLVERTRVKEKRKNTSFALGKMFKSAIEKFDFKEIEYLSLTYLDALTRNDNEIMSYIIL